MLPLGAAGAIPGPLAIVPGMTYASVAALADALGDDEAELPEPPADDEHPASARDVRVSAARALRVRRWRRGGDGCVCTGQH
jgi:hypothetical protein